MRFTIGVLALAAVMAGFGAGLAAALVLLRPAINEEEEGDDHHPQEQDGPSEEELRQPLQPFEVQFDPPAPTTIRGPVRPSSPFNYSRSLSTRRSSPGATTTATAARAVGAWMRGGGRVGQR